MLRRRTPSKSGRIHIRRSALSCFVLFLLAWGVYIRPKPKATAESGCCNVALGSSIASPAVLLFARTEPKVAAPAGFCMRGKAAVAAHLGRRSPSARRPLRGEFREVD